MSIIGKIAKEIGEEVAEGLTKKAAPKVMPAVKKPLEWGFKGRKPTDIEDLDYLDLEDQLMRKRPDPLFDSKVKSKKEMKELEQMQDDVDLNWDSLSEGSKKNKAIKEIIDDQLSSGDSLYFANQQFRFLEDLGVPRELTGKIFGNNLGQNYLYRLRQKGTPTSKSEIQRKQMTEDWKRGWLRYYNELTKSQKETFDSLSNEWYGSPNELVDVAKSL